MNNSSHNQAFLWDKRLFLEKFVASNSGTGRVQKQDWPGIKFEFEETIFAYLWNDDNL